MLYNVVPRTPTTSGGTPVAGDIGGVTGCSTDFAADANVAALNEKENTPTSSRNLLQVRDAGWAYNFPLLDNMFSPHLRDALQKNARIKAKLRRLLVREFSSAIMKQCQKPSKKVLEILAVRLVQQFPCLREQIEGSTIGSGSDGLTLKLARRIENENRKNLYEELPNEGKKRLSLSVKTMTIRKKIKLSECYGCINYSPEVEDRNEQLKIKDELLAVFNENGPKDANKIIDKMGQTYGLLREDILNRMTIPELQKNWPYLFCPISIDKHFNQLVGKSAFECIVKGIETKGNVILNYMEANGNKNARLIIYDLQKISKQVKTGQPASAATFLALMEHFAEPMDYIFQCYEVTHRT